MMNCSLHNYKEWIGAYINGSLNRKDMLLAESFLQEHPNLLDSYLNEFEEFSLVSEEIELPGKEKLNMNIVATSNIHKNNFIEYFIGSIEGMLDENKKAELDSFLIVNPKLKNEFAIYGYTRLVADLVIQYPNKNELLRKQKRPVVLFWPISVAASILLIVGLWFLWPSQTTNGVAAKGSQTIQIKTNQFYNPNPIIENNDQFVNDNLVSKNKSIVKNQDLQTAKENIRPIEKVIHTIELQTSNFKPQTPNTLALKDIPKVDINILPLKDEGIVENVPKKKGLLNKIVNDDPKYIEDYVNATFSIFKENKEDDDKWVLKIDRDENGKSKRIKFASPYFLFKSRN